jgi:hypothetical protein
MSDDDLTDKFELTMPRVTMDMVIDNIEDEKYYTWPGTTVTSCLLVLKNGYSVVGVSACAHAGNFNIVLGQELARKDAIRQIWPLMGYELRTHLHAIERPNAPNPNPHVRYDGPPVVVGDLSPVEPAPGEVRYLTGDELKGGTIAETAASLADAGVITADEAARVTPTT